MAVRADAQVIDRLGSANAGIAFTQIVRPGAPVVFGSFASSMSMQSGAPTFGTLGVSAVDSDESDAVWLTATDYLTPTTLSLAEIGQVLGVKEDTIKTHLKSLFRKLAVSNRTEAVREGLRRGFIAEH